MTTKYKPLIKYTGGKFKEYNQIKEFFPDKINNYYEPFFGGGGVFFQLLNNEKIDGKAYVNDISDTLMDFYNTVPSPEFAVELGKISKAWEEIKIFGKEFSDKFGQRFCEIMLSKSAEIFVNEEISKYIEEKLEQFKYNCHSFSILDTIIKSLNDKSNRFVKKNITKEEANQVTFKSLTTSICQAFYFVIRDMYNDWNAKGNASEYGKEEMMAHWVFIREFCFGAMFRFDANGKFNIPYGGFAYNSKCFDCKIEKIVSPEMKEVFSNVKTFCGDFEDFFNSQDFQTDDFIFLDPPYDSTFSEYDGNSFSRDDHRRLANYLKTCKCKWLMAIGKTNFIADLYKGYHIVEYDKTYMYQARGEYDSKHTTHLVITNYPIKEKEPLQLSFGF